MSTKVEHASGFKQGVKATATATSSVSSTINPMVSKFAAKSGFVIPKNKLSGSLVPIFRGSKKPGGTDAESEESTKQVLRKTKWGPDLTQEASVRKGRALAYQARVEQITQQLKSGILEDVDNQDSPLASQSAGHESLDHQNISEKSELLKLEMREAIGEILMLNPSYKAPADYKPLLKEAKVPIPIKEYPGHNFIGLIFGPASDTQKRLEKETGTKIRVYGTKRDTKKEGEIVSSDGNEAHSGYEDLYVLVSAETYEKVDAAVSLIELLVTPVSVNNVAVSTTSVAVSEDNVNGVSLNQDTPAPYTISPVLVNQGVGQPFIGSGQAPQSTQFQPYQTRWFPAGPPPSGFITPSGPMLANPLQVSSSTSNMQSLFGPRPAMSAGFGSVPQNPSLPPSRPHGSQPILQGLQRPYMLQPPRNPNLPPLQSIPGQPNFSAPPPFTPSPPTPTGPTGPAQNARPLLSTMPQSAPPFTFPDRPLTSAGWLYTPQMMQPMARPPGPTPMASQPTLGHMVQPVGPQPVVPNLIPNPVLGSMPPPHPQIKPPSITALKPPSSNDFTFHPHRAQTPPSQANPRPLPQIMPSQNLTVQPPQSPSFRPGMANPPSPSVMQGFPRPQQFSNQMSQPRGQTSMPGPPPRHPAFPGPGPVSSTVPVQQMGTRHFNPANPFPPRPGNSVQHQQNFPAMGTRPNNLLTPTNQQFGGNISFPSGRPASSPSGGQQIYDPFSPTAVSLVSQMPGNLRNTRNQESDPEYDDLMASVGVK